jgi:hypothetical protein
VGYIRLKDIQETGNQKRLAKETGLNRKKQQTLGK